MRSSEKVSYCSPVTRCDKKVQLAHALQVMETDSHLVCAVDSQRQAEAADS